MRYAVLVTTLVALLAAGCGPQPMLTATITPVPTATPTPTPLPGVTPTPSSRPPEDPHLYDYAPYHRFFARYFGDPLLTIPLFWLWAAFSVLGYLPLRGWHLLPWWLRVPKLAVHTAMSVLIYVALGALVAPAYFGGEAEFLYAPDHLGENLVQHGGLENILLWPLVIFMCLNGC